MKIKHYLCRGHYLFHTMNDFEKHFIEQLKKGEDKAYRRLYQEHYDVLCRVAYRYVEDVVVAESMVEDVIVHLWEVRENLQIKVSLRSYLLAAVRNHCLNYLQDTTQQHEQTFSSLIDEERNHIGEYLDTSSTLEEEELVRLVMQAIDRLPEESRRVFLLSREKEMTYDQIAQEIGISTNTVKYHIKQSLALLRKDLGPYLALLAWALLLQ